MSCCHNDSRGPQPHLEELRWGSSGVHLQLLLCVFVVVVVVVVAASGQQRVGGAE